MIPQILGKSAEIPAGDGVLLLASSFQGRIFAAMDGELLHRFDAQLAEHPSDSFNNIGGNSLWPAPEGGAFAFNYPPEEDIWRVQDGINRAPCILLPEGCGMEKTVVLENRKGVSAGLRFRRTVSFPSNAAGRKYGVKSLVYASCDSWELLSPLPAEDFLVSAWSLEQFDLTPGAFAFGLSEKPLNTDFYGDPSPYLTWEGKNFRFSFSAPERLQIGVPENVSPGLIGAYQPERDLLILRRIVRADAGRRINFADNDQIRGVYSAADAYSVFYGAGMNFFELETLAPVRITPEGLVSGSRLETETHFYRGCRDALASLLANEFNFHMEVLK